MNSVLIGAVESTDVALTSLAALGAAPRVVVTLPPDLAARHSDYVDVSRRAADAGATVHYAKDINDPDVVREIRRAEPDLVWIIGWSQIARAPLLDVPSLGIVGYHPSFLPRLRGRAVIPWTILLGVPSTGGTLFWIDDEQRGGPEGVLPDGDG
jgi:methionyl-tRNA formyltransferase